MLNWLVIFFLNIQYYQIECRILDKNKAHLTSINNSKLHLVLFSGESIHTESNK